MKWSKHTPFHPLSVTTRRKCPVSVLICKNISVIWKDWYQFLKVFQLEFSSIYSFMSDLLQKFLKFKTLFDIETVDRLQVSLHHLRFFLYPAGAIFWFFFFTILNCKVIWFRAIYFGLTTVYRYIFLFQDNKISLGFYRYCWFSLGTGIWSFFKYKKKIKTSSFFKVGFYFI